MAERLVNQDNSGRPGDDTYARTIERISQAGNCPFCPGYFEHEHKNPIIDETPNWLATDNMYPYENTSAHLLFVHRTHIETIDELTTEAWVELLDLVKGVVRARKILGSALVMRNGETKYTGATVSHLHAQLISGQGDPDNKVLMRVG